MVSHRRVVVTGIGIVSALGRGCAVTGEAARKGTIGIRPIESIDATDLLCRIAGEVRQADIGDDFPDYDRFTRLALIAAAEAAEQAGLDDVAIDRTRLGTLIGTGIGGSRSLDAAYERLYKQGQSRVPPMSIPRSMYNAATSAVSARHQALGPAYSIVSACSSGAHSIGQAFHWIRHGMADIVLAGGADAPLAPGIIRGWEALRVLAIDNEAPERACRPFSADRIGMVLAEGAAVLVLESMESAARRGRTPLGEIAGFGLSSDAGHVTDPSPEGAARAIQLALDEGGLAPSSIEYISAHGTATKANDVTETKAIRLVFGSLADDIPVSSTKAMHGHAMGASGAIEIGLALVALNDGIIPPTMNYGAQDPACDLDYVPNTARRGTIRTFLSNSFGFGGLNAVVALRTRQGL